MVLENLVAGLLNEHLGQFVELVDPAQLNLSVLSGKVLLTNLKVKPTALDFLQLPVKLKYGSIGRIALNANWKALGSQPVQVSIDEVLIVAEPRVDVTLDSTVELARLIQAKISALRDTEAVRLHSEQEEAEGNRGSLQEKIVDNVQVHLNKIHIRYEDYTVPDRPVSLGFVLHDLNAQATDESWIPKFVVGARTVFKLAKLDTLFVYCCVDPKSSFCGPQTKQDLTKVFVPAKELDPVALGLLLLPLSGTLRIVLNKDHVRSPHMALSMELEPVQLALSKGQYQRSLDMLSSLSIAQAALEKYLGALRATFRTPSDQEFRRYCELYKRTLNATWLAELTVAENSEKEQMERDFTEESLAKARYVAYLELKKQLKSKPVTLRVKPSRFSSLFGSSAPAVTALSEEQKQQINQQLEAFDPAQRDAHDYPKDFVLVSVNFRVPSISMNLTDNLQSMFVLSASDLTMALAQHPKNASALTVEVSAVQLQDFVTTGTRFSTPIESARSEEKIPFVCFKYEKFPLHDTVDQKVSLKVQRVQVVLHQQLLQSAYSFFTPSGPVDMHVLAAQWSVKMNQLVSTTLVSDAIRSHVATALDIQLAAPIIVLTTDPTKEEADALVADLGLFKLESNVQDRKEMVAVSEKIADLERQGLDVVLLPEEKAKLYDRYQLTVEAVQLFFTKRYSSWTRASPTHHHLFTLSEKVAALEIGKCLSPAELHLPELELTGELPELALHVSVMDSVKLLAITQSFNQLEQSSNNFILTSSDDDSNNNNRSPSHEEQKTKALGGLKDALAGKEQDWGLEDLVKLLGSKYLAGRLMEEADTDQSGSVSTTELRKWWETYQQQCKMDRLLSINFGIRQVTLQLSDDTVAGTVVPVLKTSVTALQLKLEKKPFDTDISVGLRSLNVIDTATKAEPTFLKLVDTISADGEESFVAVTLAVKEESSPDWAGARAVCNVHIGGLIVQLHPDTIRTVTSFALLKFLPAIAPKAPPSSPASITMRDDDQKTGGADVVVHTGSPTHKRSNDTRGVLDFSLDLKFDHLVVRVGIDQSQLAELDLSGLSAQVQQFPQSMHVNLGLELVQIRDVTALGEKHRLIVSRTASSKESELVRVKLDVFDKSAPDFPGHETAIEMQLCGLQVVVLNRFVDELLRYSQTRAFVELQRMLEAEREVQKLAVRAAQIANKAQQQVVAEVESSRVLIKVAVRDILLRVPTNSVRDDGLQALLSEASFTNTDKVDPKTKEPYQVFTVDMGKLIATTETGQQSAKLAVLEPLKTVIEMRPVSHSVAISVTTPGLESRVSHDQLVVLMGVVQGNLAEQATLVKLSEVEPAATSKRDSQKTDGATPQSESKNTTSFKLGLAQATLCLCAGSGGDEDSLIEAKATKFGVDMTISPGDVGPTTELRVGCAAFEVVDVSKGVGKIAQGYREILTFVEREGQEVEILKLTQTPELRDVQILLSNFKFQVTAALFELSAWADVGEIPASVSNPNPPTTNVKTTVQASLRGRMHLVENPHVAQSQHLILELANELRMEMDTDGLKLKASITELQVFQQSMELVQTGQIHKFETVKNAHVYRVLPGQRNMPAPSISVMVRQVPDGFAGPRVSIELTADPLNASFTFTSYVTLLNCMTRLQGELTPREQPVVPASNPATSSPAIVQKAQPSLAFGEQTIALNVQGFSLTLINDLLGYQLPLARINMDEIVLKAVSFQHQRDFSLSSQVFISSFSDGWEPLLEPWQFTIKGAQTATSLVPHDSMRLMVSSKHPLELNFTYAMGVNVLESLELLGSKQLEAKSDAHTFKPHHIHNHTEFELTFRPFRHSLGGLQDLDYSEMIKPFQTAQLDLDPSVMTGTAQYSLQIELVRPSAEENAPKKAYHALLVPIGTVGSTVHSLTKKLSIVCTVAMVKGTRSISFHSPIGVVNKTETALLISPELDGQVVTLRSDVVEPGHTCWMPVRAQEVLLELSLRPTFVDYALSYSMSKPVILAHPPTTDSAERNCCQSDVVGKFSFLVTSRRVKTTHTVYEISPPLILHNCLPYPINLRVAGKEDPKTSNVTIVAPRATQENQTPLLEIPKAKHLLMHACSNIADCFVSIEIQSQQSTEQKGGGFSEFTQLKLREASAAHVWQPLVTNLSTPVPGAKVLVNIEQRYENGVLVVSFFVPFWFFDLTQLSLAVTENKKELVPINSTKDQTDRQPLLFTPSSARVTHVSLATGSHGASEPISLNAMGTASTLVVPVRTNEQAELSVDISRLKGKFQRTKTITLAPRYILVNKTSTPLLIRPHARVEESIPLAPNQRVPYYGAKTAISGGQMISFRRVSEQGSGTDAYRGWRWSGKAAIDVVGTTHMQVPHDGHREFWYPFVDVWFKNCVTYVVIDENPVNEIDWRLPFRVDNECLRQTIRFRQKGSDTWSELLPLTKQSFAWEAPEYPHLVQVHLDKVGSAYQQAYDFPINEVKALAKIDLTGRKSHMWAYVKSDGPVLVLTFADEPFQEAEADSKGDDQEKLKLEGLRKGFQDDLAQLTQMKTEREQRPLELEKLTRPRDLLPDADQLQIDILSGTIPHARNTYVKVQIGQNVQQTRVSPQKWNETLRVPLIPSEIQLNTMIAISVWEENKIVADTLVGGVAHVPLLSLDSHRPSSQDITFKQGGSVKVRMWWVGTVNGHRAGDLINERIAENDRIIHILEDRLHAHVLEESEKYRFATTSEFTLILKDAIGVSNLKGVDLTKGSLQCLVEVPVIKHKSSLLLCEKVSVVEDGATSPTVSKEKRLVGHVSVAGEIPPSVRHGEAIQTRGILASLSKRVLLEKDEKIMYQVSNCNSFVEDETAASVTITDRRVIAIEHGPPLLIPLSQIIHVDHVRFGQFRWDQLKIWDSNLKELSIGIYSSNAAAFFYRIIAQNITEANKAVFARAQKGAPHHEDSKVGETLRFWSQKVKLFVPDSLLEQDDTVKLGLWFVPERGPALELANTTMHLKAVPIIKRALEGNKLPTDDVEVKLNPTGKGETPPVFVVNVKRHKAFATADRWMQRVEVKFPWIGLSVINDVPEEILYLSIKEIHAIGEIAPEQQTLMFKLGRLQLDNQNPDALYSVILAPTPMPKALEQPMIQVSLNKSTAFKRNIQVVQYASILIQKIDVQVEEELIYTLLNFMNELVQKSEFDQTQLILRGGYENSAVLKSLAPTLNATSSAERVDLFFNYLHLQPIAANISFQVNPGLRRSENYLLNPFSFLLSVVGTTFASIEQAPFRISGLVLENCRTTVEGLSEVLALHFKRKALGQFYNIFGSLEILGNPIALVDNLGTGVKDFFYEPAKGLVTSPSAFGTGLASGSLSLLKSTFSVFDAAGKIASSVGKGISQLSLDDEFIQQRRRQDQDRPEHIGDGLAAGVTSLGRGLFGGITGLVTAPIKGAKEDGAFGFVKGFGKGVVGLVAKPAAGAVDLTSQTLKGIGNTASYMLDDKLTNKPVRPRRVMDDGRVVVYNADAAFAQQRALKKELGR